MFFEETGHHGKFTNFPDPLSVQLLAALEGMGSSEEPSKPTNLRRSFEDTEELKMIDFEVP